MGYLYFKALHIVFMVTWFAGLFYIIRLFIYQHEALGESNEAIAQAMVKKFKIMAYRLWYIIAWPSMVLTLVFGVIMLPMLVGGGMDDDKIDNGGAIGGLSFFYAPHISGFSAGKIIVILL